MTLAGSFTEFPIPTHRQPMTITAGPDGNLWFTEFFRAAEKIGTVTPTGSLTEVSIPTSNGVAHGIATGPDGNVWFTEAGAGRIGRVNLSYPTSRSRAVE